MGKICGVLILRAGEVRVYLGDDLSRFEFLRRGMETGLHDVCRSVRIGKILIQRVQIYSYQIFF